MEYQIIFRDEEGYDIATPVMCEQAKDAYIEMLSQNGFKYDVMERPDKKWQSAKVVFDLQLIPAAKKAVKNNEQMKGLYTFGDPNKIAKENSAVMVECTTGEKKVAYVVGLWMATAEEIKAFKAEIGYSKLGLVIKEI